MLSDSGLQAVGLQACGACCAAGAVLGYFLHKHTSALDSDAVRAQCSVLRGVATAAGCCRLLCLLCLHFYCTTTARRLAAGTDYCAAQLVPHDEKATAPPTTYHTFGLVSLSSSSKHHAMCMGKVKLDLIKLVEQQRRLPSSPVATLHTSDVIPRVLTHTDAHVIPRVLTHTDAGTGCAVPVCEWEFMGSGGREEALFCCIHDSFMHSI